MNSFSSDFTLGIRTWFRSWSFLFRNGLGHYFIYPVVLTILLGMGSLFLIHEGVTAIMSRVGIYFDVQTAPDQSTWETIRSFLLEASKYAAYIVLWIAGTYIFSRIYKYIVLAFMSPVMALLSERAEEVLTGRSYPFDIGQFIRDVARGVALAFRNLFFELMITAALMAINFAATLFFPPLAIILTPIITLVLMAVGAYYYGFSALDYAFERRRYSLGKSVATIRSMRGLAIGNGSAFLILFYLPVIGVSLGLITSTVAAVLAIHEKERKGELPA